MTDHRAEAPGESGGPVPRDPPDQQAAPGEDTREAPPGPPDDVPDTDEAGTGRRGAPHSGAVHPEDPVPDESSG
ncbi:hypothetical protein [Streptomyces poriticola]|uniref:hypothetical protein n=1 Tax=Streptomyces poriticola TaxID=3120506 RepID=UPI002FCDED71